MRTSYFYYFIFSPVSVDDSLFLSKEGLKPIYDSKNFIYELKGKSIIFHLFKFLNKVIVPISLRALTKPLVMLVPRKRVSRAA